MQWGKSKTDGSFICHRIPRNVDKGVTVLQIYSKISDTYREEVDNTYWGERRKHSTTLCGREILNTSGNYLYFHTVIPAMRIAYETGGLCLGCGLNWRLNFFRIGVVR
jgi:hypothetical protein